MFSISMEIFKIPNVQIQKKTLAHEGNQGLHRTPLANTFKMQLVSRVQEKISHTFNYTFKNI